MGPDPWHPKGPSWEDLKRKGSEGQCTDELEEGDTEKETGDEDRGAKDFRRAREKKETMEDR